MQFQKLAALVALCCASSVYAQTAEQKDSGEKRPPAPTASSPAEKAATNHEQASKDAQGSQQPAEQSSSAPIRVEVNEVIVPVTVTDEKGKFVSDLDQKDFQVFEDNKPQHIQFFTRERNQPVVIGFLVDLSSGSKVHWKNYQDAAIELVQTLLTDEKKFSGYLITYGQDAELQVYTTSDPENIVEKLRKAKPGSGAAMFDAIYMSCTNRKLVKGEPIEPRRVVVIIGDGHDNASKRTLNEVLEIAQRNLVTIYGVSTVGYGFNSEDLKNLVKLSEETGGRVEYPLEGVYKDVIGYL